MQIGMIGLGRMGSNMARRRFRGGHECVVSERRPDEMEAYERLLHDAMAGNPTLFAREDYVEEAWRIVDPVLKTDAPVYGYEPGTWGPVEAEPKLLPPNGWHNPVVETAPAGYKGELAA